MLSALVRKLADETPQAPGETEKVMKWAQRITMTFPGIPLAQYSPIQEVLDLA